MFAGVPLLSFCFRGHETRSFSIGFSGFSSVSTPARSAASSGFSIVLPEFFLDPALDRFFGGIGSVFQYPDEVSFSDSGGDPVCSLALLTLSFFSGC